MMKNDLTLEFYHSGKLAFHLRLHQYEHLGIWSQEIISSVPDIIMRITSPHYINILNTGFKIDYKQSYAILQSLGNKLLHSSIAPDFYYNLMQDHRVLISSSFIPILEPNYKFTLKAFEYYSERQHPYELHYFKNYLRLVYLLKPDLIKKSLFPITRIEFEKHLRSECLIEVYIDNYDTHCLLSKYVDDSETFFVQFNTAGIPLFIYSL